MSIKSRKLFAILIVSMMILTMLPASVFAASTNSIDRVLTVSKGEEFTTANAPTLTIEEKKVGDFKNGDYFELALTNAEWILEDDGKITTGAITATCGTAEVTYSSKKTLGITLDLDDNDRNEEVKITVKMVTEVTEEDEAKVTVNRRDSAVTEGTYVFAVASKDKTTTTIDKVKKFAGREVTLADIRIDENSIGAMGENTDITLKLPSKYTWAKDQTLNFDVTGGFKKDDNGDNGDNGTTVKVTNDDNSAKGTRTLKLNAELNPQTGRSARGSIFLKGLKIVADRNAPFGDVVLDIDGKNITAEELVVAERLDYDVEVSVKEVKELVAGKDDNKTAKIKIEEKADGSFLANREIAVILPGWVKIVEKPTNSGFEFGSKRNELYIKVKKENDKLPSKYEFELELSIEADQTGDIVAEFSGAGVEKQEVVIAEAIAPITAEVAAADLKIGVQNQPAPDIIITETKKGMIDDDGNLTITLPEGIKFASTPEVEVTEGNLEIGKAKVVEGKELVLPVDYSSTKPSEITISDIELTLDRTVPEGEFKATIGGDAIVKNVKNKNDEDKDYHFKTAHVVKFVFANVITPAPGETRATSVFTIGDTTYTVIEQNESVEKPMDVAPYIKGDRTYLPVRYVANALGVGDANIHWDQPTKAVTIFKGDRIAQVTIGSKTLLVNGVTINMDVAPEITDNRTMLPIRWVGQALGATIDWDEEARTVTVKQ